MNTFPSFAQFFHALWGHNPHQWQQRLAEEALRGSWPAWIAVPTGAGKTACLDIAIYCLASQADLPSDARTAPVRVVFAVNRRIVVDEAFHRARAICDALATAMTQPDNTLHPIAVALRRIGGPSSRHPVEAYPLRGGTFTDNAWARSPSQPVILSTTLDQLGSRLLFRGYGVSPGSQPLHAALLGNDALLLLDEAHTSRAFSSTLEAIYALRRRHAVLSLPLHAVQLTATPPSDVIAPFVLEEAERDAAANPVLHRRLSSSKPTNFRAVPGAKGARRHEKLAAEMADCALAFLSEESRRVLVIVNRVATAQAVLENLADRQRAASRSKSAAPFPAAVAVLTGRMRPLDREAIVEELKEKHQIGRSDPDADVAPLILVATQCVEVGADFDFDALVTEIAPLDALRQRFGRLNRSGRLTRAPATILAAEESLDEAKPDRLYGTALVHVWRWLESCGAGIDFGPDALRPVLPDPALMEHCLAPVPRYPLLLAPHLDLLCQTWPKPHAEPDVSCFIHGFQRPNASVSVMIRRDLEGPTAEVEDRLAATPLLGTEMAEVPMFIAQEWLRTAGTESPLDDSGDAVDPGYIPKDRELNDRTSFVPVPWRYSHGEVQPLTSVKALLPGDVIVLPEGMDLSQLITLPSGGGSGSGSAEDQFERAHLLARDKVCIRITPESLAEVLSFAAPSDRAEVAQFIADVTILSDEYEVPPAIDPEALARAMPRLLKLISENVADPIWKHAATADGRSGRWTGESYGATGAVLRHSARVGFTPWPLEPDDLGLQGDAGSGEVLLADHQKAVAERARLFAAFLSQPLKNALSDAGLWHDIGKADPRFQAVLRRIPMYAALGSAALAKSLGTIAPSASSALTAESSLPDGFRHELLSVAALQGAQAMAAHPERDMILHLIASHHGRCRPFAPAINDPMPEPFTAMIGEDEISFAGADVPCADLAHGVADRFWSQTRRFGWWGLAYLELILRLADQTESAKPAIQPP
jgi:CRISPR-associated endonuclease/helicase Cas3